MASLGTPAGDFLVTMTDYYIDFYLKNQPEIRGCGLHDPLAVAAALDPSLVTTFGFNLQVDLEGPFRGRTIGDRSRLQDPDKHTQVALGVNVPEFLDRFMTASPRPRAGERLRFGPALFDLTFEIFAQPIHAPKWDVRQPRLLPIAYFSYTDTVEPVSVADIRETSRTNIGRGFHFDGKNLVSLFHYEIYFRISLRIWVSPIAGFDSLSYQR